MRDSEYTAPIAMTRHSALPISLYVRARNTVIIAEDWREGGSADRRARQFAAAGARVTRVTGSGYASDCCDGAWLVAVHLDGPSPAAASPEVIAADARARGALVYVHDRPDLSDFAMPGIAARGPLQVAVSSDAVAPALTRRLRAELARLLDDAGDRLDGLIAELRSVRETHAAGPARTAQLNAIAARLRVDGAIAIDDPA